MKNVFVLLVASCMIFSLIGCKNTESKAENNEVEIEEAATEDETAEVIENTEEPIDEEPEKSISFCEENSIDIYTLENPEDTYTGTISSIEYNNDENNEMDLVTLNYFDLPFEAGMNEEDNGDGTKTITINVLYDITNWDIQYNYCKSDVYVIDMATGNIFNKVRTNQVEVNGETESISFDFSSEYDENYTTQTKVYTIVCPVDYNDCGLYLADAQYPIVEDYYNISESFGKCDINFRGVITLK